MNDPSTAHLRNSPTRDMASLAAAEPDSYRQEQEIKSGRARLHFATTIRPRTFTQRRQNLIVKSAPTVGVRSSNLPDQTYRFAKPRSFLDGSGEPPGSTLPGMCGVDLTGMAPMLGLTVAAVIALHFIGKR